jgi:hypothetical protein
MPTITPSVADKTINIEVTPAHAITPSTSNSTSIQPSPDATAEITPSSTSFTPDISAASAATTIGGITVQPDINVNVGVATMTSTPFVLNSFEYTFDDFVITNPDNYSQGDIVFFTTGDNAYDSDLGQINTSTLNLGAYNNLWLFISYTGGNLVLMQKGYFDFTSESANFGTWEAGRTIYLNASGQLDITPSTTSGHWVKSLGYCIPNKENKYRVWFEADTTYLKIA